LEHVPLLADLLGLLVWIPFCGWLIFLSDVFHLNCYLWPVLFDLFYLPFD
jgi:hypothetical protein